MTDLTQELLAALRTLASRARTGRVRIVDLYEAADVGGPRGWDMSEAASALLALQDEGLIVLYRNDRTSSVTEDDRLCAVMVGGHPRHLVYLVK